MTLKIHRSDHPDLLVDALCDVIQTPLTDPFAPEIVAHFDRILHDHSDDQRTAIVNRFVAGPDGRLCEA